MWEPLADELARRGISSYGLDYPGFGSTPPWPDVEPSIDAIGDAAAETLGRLGVSSAYWVGCSMGGYVALSIAERHPGVVAGLGLVDTRSGADDDDRRRARIADAAKTERLESLEDPEARAAPLIGVDGDERAGIVGSVARIIASAAPASVAWSQRAMAGRPDRTPVLRSLDRPAVVVWGERDTLSGVDEATTMAEAIGVQVVRVPRAGHLSPLEDPSAVADALAALYAG
jgi:pimeloyl-ACP methyl ester carboxylesterase